MVDRIKEFIKVRGFQVAPSELEGHLFDHPDVGDACVVGVPDEYSGEKPFAFVVLSADAEARKRKDPASIRQVKESVMKVHTRDFQVLNAGPLSYRCYLACIRAQITLQMARRCILYRFNAEDTKRETAATRASRAS